MGFFDRINEGLSRSRQRFKEQMNVLLDRGPNLDDDFWDGLEEALILSDVGAPAACDVVERLRERATRQAMPDAYAVLDALYDEMVNTFAPVEKDIFDGEPALILFVGINGTGKTTTVGKIAKAETDAGRKVILGSADTFRAAAIEQLEVWANRAGVEMVTRERGSDPASVCYDTIERAEAQGSDLVLIDTAGRLHTSKDLMRELGKVVSVVRKRSNLPVYTVLVIDATTGQNGLQQAREFNRELDLDGLIVTKLDGTAKGGIALAVSHELGLPIYKIGVGEGIDDLRPFKARDFARALLGAFDERDESAFAEDEPEAEEAVEPSAEEIAEAAVEEAVEPEIGEDTAEEAEEAAEDDAPEVEGAAPEEAAEPEDEDEPEVAEAQEEPEAGDEAAAEEAADDEAADEHPEPEDEPGVGVGAVAADADGAAAVEDAEAGEGDADAQPQAGEETEEPEEPAAAEEQPKKSWWKKLWE